MHGLIHPDLFRQQAYLDGAWMEADNAAALAVINPASGERLGAVTASFGVARLRDGESADELLRRVDAKLYEAKANGRNRVVADASGSVANETAS